MIITGAVGALQAACSTGLVPPGAVSSPATMARSLARLLAGGAYDADILLSFGEVAAAAVLAVGLGFVTGAVVHALPWLRVALRPWLASYYAVPTFILYPVFIITFGVGRVSIVAMAVALAIVVMIEATLTALDRIPPVLIKTARMQRLGPLGTVWRVVLPAAMPGIFTGVKLAVAYAFIGVIASEFILSGAGLGYAIAYAYNNFATADMYGLILLVLIAVTAVNAVLDVADRRLQARFHVAEP